MEPHNYEPDDWQLESEIEDDTAGLFEQSDAFENETTRLDSDDALEMGDFVWEAFDAVINPNYSDS